MGNVPGGAKTAPIIEAKAAQVYQFPVRKAMSMDRIPEDLISPIVPRLDPTQVREALPWDERYNAKFLKIFRHNVVITFETDCVAIQPSCSLGLLLTLKVFIPRKKYRGPLDDSEFQLCILQEEFIFYTRTNNDEVVEALQKRLEFIFSHVAVRRLVFDIRNYALPQILQDGLSEVFASKKAYYNTLGVKLHCQRLDGMTNFFASLPAQFFELNCDFYSYEEKFINFEHVSMNIDFGWDKQRVKLFIISRLAEWRLGFRKILVYKVQNYMANIVDVIPTGMGWPHQVCNCGKAMILFASDDRKIRIVHLGTNLVIHDSEFKEYKQEKKKHFFCAPV